MADDVSNNVICTIMPPANLL